MLVAAAPGCDSFGAGANPAVEAGDTGSPPPTGDGSPPTDSPPGTDTYRAAVLADQPIAYFRFEETSGTSPKNAIAGSPVTAVLPSAGISLAAEGISAGRRAIRFETTTGQLNVYGAMKFKGDDEFTVEAWAELTTVGANDVFVFVNMDNAGVPARVGQWLILQPSGLLRAETWNDGGLVYYAQALTGALPQPSWSHIVFLHSNADQRDVLYVNTKTADASRITNDQRVAPQAALSWSGFTGRLAELAIYAKPLTPARIAAHYQAR